MTFTGGSLLGQPGNKAAVNPADLAVKLDGTGYGASAKPVALTDRSFAVTGWAKLDTVTGDQVIAAQSGVNGSRFELGLIGGQWTFRVRTSDDADAPFDTAASTAAPLDGKGWTGRWVFLAGGYNQATGKLTLWVNTPDDPPAAEGEPSTPVLSGPAAAQTTSAAPAWDATGSLIIGAAQTAPDTLTRNLIGTVDDVRIYPHADETTIHLIYGDAES